MGKSRKADAARARRDLMEAVEVGRAVAAQAGRELEQFEQELLDEVVMVSAAKVRAQERRRLDRAHALAEQERQRRTMVDCLQVMVDRQDWRGVVDAAADLREIDARLLLLREDQDA